MKRTATEDEKALTLTVTESARLLNLSPTAIYRLVSKGRLKKVDLGSAAIRIPRASIDRLIEQAMSVEPAERASA